MYNKHIGMALATRECVCMSSRSWVDSIERRDAYYVPSALLTYLLHSHSLESIQGMTSMTAPIDYMPSLAKAGEACGGSQPVTWASLQSPRAIHSWSVGRAISRGGAKKGWKTVRTVQVCWHVVCICGWEGF